jgi:hypothetical protein
MHAQCGSSPFLLCDGGRVRLERGDSPNHGLVRKNLPGFEVPGIYDFPASRILTSALPCSLNE